MYAKFFKRILDFFLSLAAIIVLSPVMLVLVVLGAVKMKGNPFFHTASPRQGRKDFQAYKVPHHELRKG